MVRIFVRHRVADYKTWRKAYDAFDPERKRLGATGHAVYQTIDDPNDVTAWHDFETLEKAKAFGASPALREAMGRGGAQSPLVVWFTTQAH